MRSHLVFSFFRKIVFVSSSSLRVTFRPKRNPFLLTLWEDHIVYKSGLPWSVQQFRLDVKKNGGGHGTTKRLLGKESQTYLLIWLISDQNDSYYLRSSISTSCFSEPNISRRGLTTFITPYKKPSVYLYPQYPWPKYYSNLKRQILRVSTFNVTWNLWQCVLLWSIHPPIDS